jgi:hypothetical protein
MKRWLHHFNDFWRLGKQAHLPSQQPILRSLVFPLVLPSIAVLSEQIILIYWNV